MSAQCPVFPKADMAERRALPHCVTHTPAQAARTLSTKHELRYGSKGSLSIDQAKGTWFDHEASEGGGKRR
jgi:putative DNA primase/helicase